MNNIDHKLYNLQEVNLVPIQLDKNLHIQFHKLNSQVGKQLRISFDLKLNKLQYLIRLQQYYSKLNNCQPNHSMYNIKVRIQYKYGKWLKSFHSFINIENHMQLDLINMERDKHYIEFVKDQYNIHNIYDTVSI